MNRKRKAFNYSLHLSPRCFDVFVVCSVFLYIYFPCILVAETEFPPNLNLKKALLRSEDGEGCG